jgi:hypothetical protein
MGTAPGRTTWPTPRRCPACGTTSWAAGCRPRRSASSRWQDASERTKAIAQLKADGFEMINGRPVEDIIITKQKAATLKPTTCRR